MTTETKAARMEIGLSWSGDLRFEAQDGKGLKLALDGDTAAAFSPTEALLSSLCACLGIDVVQILHKMRLDLRALDVRAQAERNPEPPKYFRKVHLDFHLQGNLPQDKVERAVELSFEKYCSVLHSLRQDLEVTRNIHIEAP